MRTEFIEIPPGTQKIQGLPQIVKKNYDKTTAEYTYSDYTGTVTCTAYLYDSQYAYITSFSAKTGVDISAYPWAEYVRFTVSFGGTYLYPDELPDTSYNYYFLKSFDFLSDILSWKFDENKRIFNPESPVVPKKNMSAPYPAALWRIDEKIADLPYHELMPLEIPSGAFMNAVNLEYARIPETVRKIGRYSFRNTALQKVKISSECVFYKTSFPENCVIEFYGNSLNKNSGQLYDCNKNTLIDSDGARIYIQEE